MLSLSSSLLLHLSRPHRYASIIYHGFISISLLSAELLRADATYFWNSKSQDRSSASAQVKRTTLRITTLEVEPYVMLDRSSGNHSSQGSRKYIGYIPDLIDKISSILGFRYELYVVPDGSYGYRRPGGRWNGMIGELLNGVADIAAGPTIPTSVRREVVDFTEPFLISHATLLLRKAPLGSELPLNNISDIVEQSEIKYGTISSGIIPRTFKLTNDSLMRTMWRNMRRFGPSVFTETNEEGIERVRRDKYGFVLPDTIAEYISLRKPCEFATVGKFLITMTYALAVPKKSPHLIQINGVMGSLQTSGYLDSLKQRWWEGRSECSAMRSSMMYRSDWSASATSSITSSYTTTFLICIQTISILIYYSIS